VQAANTNHNAVHGRFRRTGHLRSRAKGADFDSQPPPLAQELNCAEKSSPRPWDTDYWRGGAWGWGPGAGGGGGVGLCRQAERWRGHCGPTPELQGGVRIHRVFVAEGHNAVQWHGGRLYCVCQSLLKWLAYCGSPGLL